MYGSIHLTSYCSASAIIGLNTAGQVIKNFGKKQKRTPLVNHEVDKVIPCLCAAGHQLALQAACARRPYCGFCNARRAYCFTELNVFCWFHRAECLWLVDRLYNEQLN